MVRSIARGGGRNAPAWAVLMLAVILVTGPAGAVPRNSSLLAAAGGAAQTMHFSAVLTDPSTGSPISGSLDMAFAIFDAESGGNSLWTETQNAVQVRRGVLSVQLGSATPFPAGLFDGSARYLEMQILPDPPLAPRVAISRVGNAFFADRAADVRCAGGQCVDKEDVKDKAIGREKLEDKAVGRGQIDDKGVGRGQIDDKAVGRGQIDDRAVGRSQLDLEVLRLMREQPGARAPFRVSRLGDSQGQVDVAVGADGLPVVVAAMADGNARLFHCEDPACAEVIGVTLGPLAAGTHAPVVVTGGDGNPLVVYRDAVDGLVAVHCSDASCTDRSRTSPVGAPSGTPIAAMVGIDGLPLVLFGEELVHCADAVCSAFDGGLPIPNGVPRPSVTIGSDGMPLSVFLAGNEIRVTRCSDVRCSTAPSAETPVSGVSGPGISAVAVGADGLAVIAYVTSAPATSDYSVNVRHCADLTCSATDGGSVVDVSSPAGLAAETGADGFPFFVVRDTAGTGGLALSTVRCTKIDCSGVTRSPVLPTGTVTLPLTPADDAFPAVSIGSDGWPVIALPMEDGDAVPSIGVIHCSNRFCLPYFNGH